MIIKKIPIDQVNPAPYNPRKDLQPEDPEYQKLQKSIDEFDIVEPLIWNKRSGNLVGGHQRLKILIARGDTEVEVSVVDLDDAKERALNLALNKISGEWDNPKLKDLLEELDTGAFDMEITGFSIEEIEDLMTQLHEPEEGLTDDDAIPEATESISKRGDLYILGNHRLLCGDATVMADVERLMGGEKADMVFTDPPYGISVVGKDGKIGGGSWVGPKYYPSQKFRKIIGDDKPFDPSMILKLAPIICLFGANHYASRLPDSPSWIVWHKGQTANFSACELIWTNIGGHIKYYDYTWNGMTRKGAKADELISRIHPTQKPVGLIVDILIDYKTNDILDPYGGSGSTLIACEKLNRRCFMLEIDEKYCDVIVKRWEEFTGKEATRE